MRKALILLSLVVAARASAEEIKWERRLVAANAWLGVGYGLQSVPSTGVSGVTVEAGGDVGINVLPNLAITAVGEWGPVIADVPVGFTSLARAGLGVRWKMFGGTELLFSPQWAGWLEAGRLFSGAGGEVFAFVPLQRGFGFYAKAGYHVFTPSKLDLRVLTLSGGASYSF